MYPAGRSKVIRVTSNVLLAGWLGFGFAGCGSGIRIPATPVSLPNPSAAVTVSVSGAGQVSVNATAQFSATVLNASNTSVTWQVDGIAGGSTTTGTISATGFYTAPAVSPNTVTITAVSQSTPSASGTAVETILNLAPVLTTATATQTGANGLVLIDVHGTGFLSSAQLQAVGLSLTTQFVSSTELQATFAPAVGTLSTTVTATNPNSGLALSNAVTAQIPQITVAIVGPAATRLGLTVQFLAGVTNSPNTSVTWQVNGVAGGTSTTGTISLSGLYTAPSALPSPNPLTITAVSQAAPTISGSLPEQIWNDVPVLTTASATASGTTGALLIDVQGAGFATGAQINLDGIAQSTQVFSAGELQTIFTPASGKTSIVITVVNPNPGSAASNAFTVNLPAVLVTVAGASQTRLSQTTQFSANVIYSANTSVTWQVNGVIGGAVATGTISATGLYTAPAALPAANPVTITAVSQAAPTVSGSLQETVWNAIPVISSGTATPTGNTGALLIDLIGTNFAPGAQIQVAGVVQTAQFLSTTELQTTINPTAGATPVAIAVVNPNPGSATSNTINITLPTITVTVAGAAQTRLSQTTQFSASLTGTSNTAVTWQVNGITGGAAATGTISTTGLYTAPTTLPSPNPVTITAVSQESSTATGSLQENIWNPIPTITAVVPTLTNTAGQVLLDVTGTNFAGGAQIQVAGSSLTTTLISATEATAIYSPGTGVTTINVDVINPNPGSAASNIVTVTLPQIYAYTGPVPVDETLSPYFLASAGGVPLHVYWAQVRIVNFFQFTSTFTGGSFDPYPPYADNLGKASFASIQLSGNSDVSISFPMGYPKAGQLTSSSQVKILPTGAIDPTTIHIVNGAIQFAVSCTGTAQQLTIEVDGDYLNSMELFINPFEVYPKTASMIPPGYITQSTIDSYPSPYHFGPGEYIVNGNINFRVNADIYLEDGAIIKWFPPFYPQVNTGPMITLGGNPANPMVNMYMHGSGIVDGSAQQQVAANNNIGCGYNTHPLNLNNLTVTPTTKIGVDGIIIRNGCTWNLPVAGVVGTASNHVVINNVKIMGYGGEQANSASASDGIDILAGDQYIDITHSYIRTADDLIVVDQTTGPTNTIPTSNITATNNILWNELAHALSLCCIYPSSQASDTAGVDNVLFDHNTIIHDTGKASLLAVLSVYNGVSKNITFSNITVEESRSLINISTGPGYGVTANPAIVQNITFSNINQLAPQVTQTIGTYIVPVPNIQLLVQLPYGNSYVGNGTTAGTNPAVLQGPFVFNNVVVAGQPVTSYTYAPGFQNTSGGTVPENVINETMLLRTQNTYGPFVYEPQWIPLDILNTTACNGSPCLFAP